MAKFGPIERQAISLLAKHLGWWGALKCVWRIQQAELRGEPFADLPTATGFKEIGSREQAGGAVLLYRALLVEHSQQDALRIAADVVAAGAQIFLAGNLGVLSRERVQGLAAHEREEWARQQGEKFPNATMEWELITDERVHFTVSACRLNELATTCGHPELGPIFCAGDAAFFSSHGVRLERPQTLASHGKPCQFRLSFEEEA